eukprot:scaffold47512_cov68-Phaeocystis_antarctica.AAC.3
MEASPGLFIEAWLGLGSGLGAGLETSSRPPESCRAGVLGGEFQSMPPGPRPKPAPAVPAPGPAPAPVPAPVPAAPRSCRASETRAARAGLRRCTLWGRG